MGTPGTNRVCSVEGCDRPYRCTGYCELHYARWRKSGSVELQERHRADRGICPECGVTEFNPKQARRCMPCYTKDRRSKIKARWVDAAGYVVLGNRFDHPNADRRGQLREHVFVMSEMIGRALLPGENVHHKNGARDDNRPENLEIWSTSQPAGQRIPDKVHWAKELLSLYEPEALAQPFLRAVEDLPA